MSDRPCTDLKHKVEEAQREYEEAREEARAEIVSEPLEPENMPPALEGSQRSDPGDAEKAARRRLEVAERAYHDCEQLSR